MIDPFEVKPTGEVIPIDPATFMLRRKYLTDQLRIVVQELHKLYYGHALFTCPYPVGTKCQFLSALGPVAGEVIETAYIHKPPYYQLKIRILSDGTLQDRWVDDFKRLIFTGAKNANKTKA